MLVLGVVDEGLRILEGHKVGESASLKHESNIRLFVNQGWNPEVLATQQAMPVVIQLVVK